MRTDEKKRWPTREEFEELEFAEPDEQMCKSLAYWASINIEGARNAYIAIAKLPEILDPNLIKASEIRELFNKSAVYGVEEIVDRFIESGLCIDDLPEEPSWVGTASNYEWAFIASHIKKQKLHRRICDRMWPTHPPQNSQRIAIEFFESDDVEEVNEAASLCQMDVSWEEKAD